MSASDVAISVRGLSKAYIISHDCLKRPSFREVVVEKIRHPLRKVNQETFWALNDVSFDVKKGDVVGIIGRNGAGKSTLLKVLSRIIEPTKGAVDIYGRVGSLLEVGTGFHPELTGRENIYLNGAILGMRRNEIRREFEAIVEFAEVARFLDTPVKRYSSGMYVRLAFAVAAHLNPEILIVDEVLAVGDAQFQKKCLGKMQEVSTQGGRTVLFVSHNMAAVRNLCLTGVWMQGGRVREMGSIQEVVDHYSNEIERQFTVDLRKRTNRSGTGAARCVDVQLFNPSGKAILQIAPGEPFVIQIAYESSGPLATLGAAIDVETIEGTRVTTLWTGFLNKWFTSKEQGGLLQCHVDGLPLRPDRYVINIGLGTDKETMDYVQDAMALEVRDDDLYGTGRMPERAHGFLVGSYRWTDGPYPPRHGSHKIVPTEGA